MKSEETKQCGRAEIAGQSLQATLRRGWYYGPADFRHWLLEKAEGVLAAKTQGRAAKITRARKSPPTMKRPRNAGWTKG